MKQVRTGVVGLGVMGKGHIKTIGETSAGVVVAVCDNQPERIEALKNDKLIDKGVKCFTDYRELIERADCDCIAIVTPHPAHLEIAEAAFFAGKHVMVDKPITITASEADRMLKACKQAGTKFSTMYSMRTSACNKVIRDWIKQGKLGEVRRVEFTCTEWLRTQTYFDEQKWRGTWKGEGAGLLLNQAPHNLDLLYWWFGPAATIDAVATSRFHDIETEDEVSARIVTESGIPIQFYSTTGEAPGKDYLEIVGTLGSLIRTGNKVRFRKLAEPLDIYIRESDKTMSAIPSEEIEVEIPDLPRGHKIIFEDLFDAILNDRGNDTLAAPGEDGIHAVEWANAMLMSSVKKQEISLPVDREEYDDLLAEFRGGKIKL